MWEIKFSAAVLWKMIESKCRNINMLNLKIISSEVKNHHFGIHFNAYGERYNLKIYEDIVELLGI